MAAGKDCQALTKVPQLSNVSFPAALRDFIQSFHGDRTNFPLRKLFQKISDQQADILFALSQRRKPQCQDAQAVIKILPKTSVLHQFFEIPVSSRNDPYVDRGYLTGPQPSDFPLLQDPQET